MPEEHSTQAPPSGAPRWLACPGVINATKGMPDTSSKAAADGTVTHYIVERCLMKGTTADKFLGLFGCISKSGITYIYDRLRPEAQFCFEIEQDRIDRANLYLQYISNRYYAMKNPTMYIECRVDASYWAAGCFGTVDCLLIDENSEIDIIDLKDGQGIIQPNSPQLLIYALGALGPMNVHNVSNINLTIVQPKDINAPIKVQAMTAVQLYKWGEEVLRPGALATQDPAAPRIPGSHCLYCKREATCPEKRQALLEEFAVIDLPVVETMPAPIKAPPEPLSLTAEQLDKLLSFLPEFERWATAVRAEAFRRLAQYTDDAPKTLKLVQGKAKRTWAKDVKALETELEFLLPQYQMYDMKFNSPAKMEKAVAAGENPRNHNMTSREIVAALKPFISITHGKSMVGIDNPKPALIPGVSDFEGIDLDAVFS